MEKLKCPIDFAYFTSSNPPLVLNCGHTFCKDCLIKLKSEKGIIICPTDQVEHNLSVEALPKNHIVVSLLDSSQEEAKKPSLVKEEKKEAKKKYIYSSDLYGENCYFFIGDEFYKYSFFNPGKTLEGYPMKLNDGWNGIWSKGFDACFFHENVGYFFKGEEYIRYNVSENHAESGYPKPIKGDWPGLDFKSIDAALSHLDDQVFFFKGNQFIKYDMIANKAVSDYPQSISEGWKGIWRDGIDSAGIWQGSTAYIYFFRKRSYIRFNMCTNKADFGFPIKVSDGWTGIPDIQ